MLLRPDPGFPDRTCRPSLSITVNVEHSSSADRFEEDSTSSSVYFPHNMLEQQPTMTSKASGTKEMGNQDCEKQEQNQESNEESDIFDVFLPSLWTLKATGVWMPGDLRTAPSLRESLPRGPKATLYLLYCLVVFVSIWVHFLRFLPYTVKQSGGELIMALVVFASFFTPACMFAATLSLRRSLVALVRCLRTYYKRYGQRRYIKDMIKTGKIMHTASMIGVAVFLISQSLLFYKWSTVFHWITTPVDSEAPPHVLVPWKIFLVTVWILVGVSQVSDMGFVRYVSIILRNEFSEFNQAMKTLMDALHSSRVSRENTTDYNDSRNIKSGDVKQIRVAQAPRNVGWKDGSTLLKEGTCDDDVVVTSERLEDLRCRFEDLVDLVEMGNAVVKYQLLDVYLYCIPFLCLIIKGFIDVPHIRDYIIYMTFCFIALSCTVIYYSIQAVRLNMEAHASCQYLLKAKVTALSEKSIQIINLFVYRLHGPQIGFSLLGLVTIDVSFILTLVGTLIAYIFVVLQFNTQPSCPVAVTPEACSSAFPLNCSLGAV